MILDARTVALLVVDLLSAALCVLLAWAGWRGRARGRPAADPQEDLEPLVALAAGALFLLRLVAWGGFFLVLDGYVPAFAAEGVMCPYGVVELRPELARAALWAKPAALFLLLAWWAVAAAERGVARAPFLRLRLAVLAPLALLVAAEIALEFAWLAAEKRPFATLCCSAAGVAERGSAWTQPGAVLGLAGLPALALWGTAKALLVAGALAFARAGRAARGPRLGPALALALAGLSVAALDLATWREVVAPRALGLEFHRCAFELATRSLALGPAALLAALAHLALFALPVLALLAPREPDGVARASAGLARLAALFLATELLVVLVHAL